VIGEAGEVDPGRTLQADVCVIGGGPAGISIAAELASGPLEVILLESGGLAAEAETQALCEGLQRGAPQWPLDKIRLRLLGGTSNHWAGLCRPFDGLDLRERVWVPHSGWPLRPEDLARYDPRAFELCGVSLDAFVAKARSGLLDPGPELRAEGVELKLAVSTPGVRFGQRHRSLLGGSQRIRVLLHANASEIVPGPTLRSVERVEVRTLGGRHFFVAARAFVLACGAIENARLLLLSDRVNPKGLGNDRDLVGRYYTDHPSAKPLAILQLLDAAPPPISAAEQRRADPWVTALALEPEVQARNELANGAVFAFGFEDAEALAEFQWMGTRLLPPGDDSVLRFLQQLAPERGPLRAAVCWLESEQFPNPESRVTLGEELDALGQRKVVVDWRLSDRDRRSLARTGLLLAEAFGRCGAGRMKLWPWLLETEPDAWRHLFPGGWHAMGTTRMAADPSRGVVDPNCRVFGLDNLYLAGSSVFPTGSYDTPTVKLLALALRLADHLKAELAGRRSAARHANVAG
jgi:choline dehydrogenase-like flavoprotein